MPAVPPITSGGGAALYTTAAGAAATPSLNPRLGRPREWLAAAARDELTDFVRRDPEAADAPPTPPPLSATKSFGLLPPSRPSTAPKLL